MIAIYRNSISKSWGQVLGWSLSLGILGGYILSLYDTFAKPEMRDMMSRLLNNYPKELLAFFGGTLDMYSPTGYLNMEFFSYMPLILGIYAVLVGSGLLSADEENGQLDLLLAQPVSRGGFFWGRLAGFFSSILAILLVLWLGFALILPSTGLQEISARQLAYPFFSLLGQLILFGALALLLSQLLPSRRLAAMLCGLLLVASFFINSLSIIQEDLKQVAKYLPLNYYQGALAMNGMRWEWLGWLLAVSGLLCLLAWQVFERRDIRVSGEGGWRLPAVNLQNRHSLRM